MSSVRILCFNIHGGRSMDGQRDLARIHALLDEHKIDIAVFQEMETRAHRGGKLTDIQLLAGQDRPHYLPGPNMVHGDGWYGNLLISRYPILRSLNHNLETVRYLEPRSAVDALVETPLGKIRIIGTHLSLSPFERLSEGRTLVRLMDAVEEKEKNPVILMGDMNEWRSNSKLFEHLNQILTPVPCRATFPSFRPVFKLDRVWHDDQLNVKTDVLAGRKIKILSDHLPVLIELSAKA